ncbi:MAG: hypothetical protein WB445_09450 [Acinetobacter sp.]
MPTPNADKLRSFAVNILTFWAIHGGVLKRSFARKASCGAVRLTAKPVHFLHLNDFVAKTVHFKDHRFALHCKQSSALFLLLRLALRIKAVLLFLLRLRMTLPRIK